MCCLKEPQPYGPEDPGVVTVEMFIASICVQITIKVPWAQASKSPPTLFAAGGDTSEHNGMCPTSSPPVDLAERIPNLKRLTAMVKVLRILLLQRQAAACGGQTNGDAGINDKQLQQALQKWGSSYGRATLNKWVGDLLIKAQPPLAVRRGGLHITDEGARALCHYLEKEQGDK